MAHLASGTVTDQRALLTEKEREILSGEIEVDNNYRYSVESRVRSRLKEQLPQDLDLLEEHQPEMYQTVQELFIDDTAGEDVQENAHTRQRDEQRGHDQPQPGGEIETQLREELAGSGDLLTARVEEVLKMYDELQQRGEATKSDLLAVVDVEKTRYDSDESVWSNMVKGRDTLRALPGVEKPRTGMKKWRYTPQEDI